MNGLTTAQKASYERDGFVVVEGVLNGDECDDMIGHMDSLQSGRKELEGFEPREPDNLNRTHNQHLYDPKALELLLHQGLRRPLADCFNDEAEGIQTMYFWTGSEQRRHQDQFYLPGCMSAWLALEDVSRRNGTIYVQPGSHKLHLVTRAELTERFGDNRNLDGGPYSDCVDEQFEKNELPETPVEVSKGDVVLFHGVLIHRGGPIDEPGSSRHVMANHYIPYHFDDWPHHAWLRFDFDGNRRHHPAPEDAAGD